MRLKNNFDVENVYGWVWKIYNFTSSIVILLLNIINHFVY